MRAGAIFVTKRRKRTNSNKISSLKAGRGIYVGESLRSLYERIKEHQSDRNSRKEESHQVKHWLSDHRDMEEPPTFTFKAVQYFNDPMNRQLAEAVRIDLRGEGILN